MVAADEFKSHCVAADTDDFINHYFNISSAVVENVFKQMVKAGHYNDITQLWPSIPQESTQDATCYSPLITVCEAIRKAHNNHDDKHYSCRWFTSSNNHPENPDTSSNLIRPDVFLLLGIEDEADRWEEKLDQLKTDESELVKYATAWWLRVSVIVEVKHKEDDESSRVTQLMTYLCHVLREQLDRWFVPGFLLTGTQFSAWVVDRSGPCGTQKSFNFHKEPKKFIQVILACSVLPPTRLGWDTSMKLWKTPEPLHSFHENIDIEDYVESAHVRQWVFEMPVRNEDDKLDGERGLFLTTKALSVGTDCMQGRATVVWAVQRLNDGQVASDEIFIMKQCWRPVTAKPEGELYPPADEAEKHHIGCVYSYEDVKVNGIMIDTQKFIRGGLKYNDPLPVANINKSRKRKAENIEIEDEQKSHVFVVPVTVYDPFISNLEEVDITDRVLSRTLLFRSYGWPLHRFSDRLELVRVCEHIVEALEFLYFEKGIIQCDISLENVLISSISDVNGATGCLIDFDNARVVEEKKPTIIHETETWLLSKRRQKYRDIFEFLGKKLPPRAAHALAFYNDALDYLADLKTIIDKSSVSHARDLSDEDIGFLSNDNIQIPDLTKHKPRNAKQCATLPFASPEVLNAERRIFDLSLPHPRIGLEDSDTDSEDLETDSEDSQTDFVDSKTDPDNPKTKESEDSETDSGGSESDSKEDYLGITPHDARHDLEALFWCMTYICVTRGGPGGKRRKELRPEFEGKGKQKVMKLRNINYYFFSSDEGTLIHNKTKLFERNDYNKAIVHHFHPYFEPLKPLMRQWWNILRFAHRYPMFETIHKTLRKALQKTIRKLLKQRASPRDLRKTAEVIEAREKELEEIRCPFHYKFSTDPEELVSRAPFDASRNNRSNYRGSAPSRSTSQPRKKVKK